MFIHGANWQENLVKLFEKAAQLLIIYFGIIEATQSFLQAPSVQTAFVVNI